MRPVSDTSSPAPPPDVEPDSPPAPEWVTLADASDDVGVSVSALRKAYRAGRIAHRKVPGPYGEQVEVDLPEVARVMGQARGRATPALPPDYLPVPRDQWSQVLAQLGNLHEAGQALAEARERAARAETEATFLREQLREARARETERQEAELAALEVAEAVQGTVEGYPRRRWWQRQG